MYHTFSFFGFMHRSVHTPFLLHTYKLHFGEKKLCPSIRLYVNYYVHLLLYSNVLLINTINLSKKLILLIYLKK